MMVAKRGAAVYDFSENEVPGSTARDRGYWRDVGTLDSYYDAHMDLVSVHPIFNLYNRQWPILTSVPACRRRSSSSTRRERSVRRRTRW
jgi:glucose-1-phosphate adenylyltransferase